METEHSTNEILEEVSRSLHALAEKPATAASPYSWEHVITTLFAFGMLLLAFLTFIAHTNDKIESLRAELAQVQAIQKTVLEANKRQDDRLDNMDEHGTRHSNIDGSNMRGALEATVNLLQEHRQFTEPHKKIPFLVPDLDETVAPPHG